MISWIKRRDKNILILFFSIAIMVIPIQFTDSIYWMKFITEMLILALLSLSIGMLIGSVGLLSFGQAAFFGLGAYFISIFEIRYSMPMLLILVITLSIIFALAVIIGWLCSRLSGIQFAMATFAFAQLFWTLAVKLRGLTNGDDGMRVLFAKESIFLSSPILLSISGSVVFGSFYILNKIDKSPFGQLLKVIKENEIRVPLMGYSTAYAKTMYFGISSLIAAMGGILYVFLKEFVSPDVLYWSISGTGVVMALLGGTANLLGPLVGAGVFMFLQDWLSSYTDNWMIFIGILLILIMLVENQGLIGLSNRIYSNILKMSNK